METLRDWMREATPDRRSVTFCIDRALLDELERARSELERYRDGLDGMADAEGRLGELEARIADLEQRVRNKTKTVVIESIGWGRWRDLMAKHPPLEDQIDVFSRAVELGVMPHALRSVTFNAQTFYPEAFAACIVEPSVAVEDVMPFLESMPAGIIDRLVAALHDVNTAGQTDPKVEISSNGRLSTAPN